MNVYCIVMFKFNYSVWDIKNSNLGEGIVCLGEGSCGKWGGKWGKWGREVGIRGREVGNAYPLSTPPLPCSRSTWFSFPAGASHGVLSLLVFHKFPTLKFCHNNQTKWLPLIDISLAMTPSLPQAIFFSHAPLQKNAMKSCQQDILKTYLSCCIET